MTRINRVALTGFKSFRKKTVVPFFDGLTAIIGENGAGKSNLFDAISFVMGRRSSQLRSDRMEHLIFNGGEKYPPAQAAEVVLHLSNTNHLFDHLLANGDSPPEITIGRRISHGSSSYYFMGKACSRAMVDQVLVQAKIDPDGQQLIAQGALTKVIKDNAATRRQIIDEICGIAAYDEKRNKAIVELKEVKSKLNTHRIILAERRRRLLSLSQERDAALEYQRMTQELNHLETSIQYLKRKKAEEKLLLSEKERAQFSGRIEPLQEDVKKLDLQVENKEWELESVREETHGDGQIDLIKEVEHLRSEISRKQGEIDLKRQQAANLHQMIDEVTRIKAAEEARNKTAAKRSGAVQAILERKRSGVYGTIASIATPNSGFEIPFQTAAAGHLNDIVVDSRETALNCINYLKENDLGRARILPLRRLVTRPKSLASADALKLPGLIDYAINLVDFDPKYRRAFEYILYDTVVSEHLEALRDIDGVRAVTLDGDLQSKGGALTGGSRIGTRKEQPGTRVPAASTFDAARKRQQISKIGREIGDLEEKIEELTDELQRKEQEFSKQQQESTLAKGETVTRSDDLRALRDKRRETYRQLENMRRGVARYEREEAQARAELEAFGKQEQDDSYYAKDSLRQLEQLVQKNRKDLRRLEPINMRAIDECKAYEQEFDILSERVTALQTEKHEIEILIGQIEQRKKELFLSTLAQINEHFERIFHELFEGGTASLELEESENINSGLLIKANPPDKEPHLIDSLSGGEQTLVATAFIFALQEYQQTPLFILDEIDAALDLVNITRLARMLRYYAERIQVIFVSHNNETIRHADRAYGVTMKNGVSKILALKLN